MKSPFSSLISKSILLLIYSSNSRCCESVHAFAYLFAISAHTQHFACADHCGKPLRISPGCGKLLLPAFFSTDIHSDAAIMEKKCGKQC
jgi:hypothetical protein